MGERNIGYNLNRFEDTLNRLGLSFDSPEDQGGWRYDFWCDLCEYWANIEFSKGEKREITYTSMVSAETIMVPKSILEKKTQGMVFNSRKVKPTKMECKKLNQWYEIVRCENNEVICYVLDATRKGGIHCRFKDE
jgi:hypothetical protein